ncbi:MAG: beta-ketoacyl synthase N-terminal-like domain-containing protein, partial [Shewanella sp.]
EGAGVLVLKRVEDALRDGDNIYAIVSGIGLSNDGKGQFVLSPNSKGQVQAFERAYRAANTAPANIEVIECHATGTPLGDKVELASMERFFEDKLAGTAVPLIGSAKSNLGHLLTAAGMPGIMKMIFAMRSGHVPPSINLSAPISSPKGLFSAHNLPTDIQAWPDKAGNDRRHAGVSVFGFGGCNAHLLLESSPAANTSSPSPQSATTISYPHPPLTIIGLASHFGPLSSINALDRSLIAKQHAFIPLPTQRWKGLDKHPEILANCGLTAVPQGAYIDQFEFDFLRFKVPPNEDDRLISQQLLLIKIADEAIRDANLKPGSKVAVLVAMETELELHQFRGRVNLHTQLAESLKRQGINLTPAEYLALETIAMDSVLDAAKLNQYTSFIGNIMASRIASLWDFNGPAFTISAAELSVARCIDVAENLLSQESLDAVVIAAVDLSGSAEQVILKHALAPVALNASSAGWKVGEGAGAFVLTSMPPSAADSQAQHGQYKGYGQLCGQMFGATGNPQGLSNPARICDDLLTQTQVPSHQVRLIETCMAIEQAVDTPPPHHRLLPSVSQRHQAADTIGHCFAAAGMASILSALLQLKNQVLLEQQAPLTSQAQHALVATFGQGHCAQLLLRQSAAQAHHLQQRLEQDLTLSEQKHLIKQVTLGGRDIYQHILDTPLTGIEAIQQKAQTMMALPAKRPRSPLAMALSPTIAARFAPSRPITARQQETLSKIPMNALTTPNQQAAQAELTDAAFCRNQQLAREAHLAFLHSRVEGLQLADTLMKAQQANELTANGQTAPAQTNIQACAPTPADKPCIWHYADLVEYAEGDIAKVFGPDYAIIDSYPRRVRLPTTDYLLVSRVTQLNAKMGRFEPCTM